MTRIPKRVSTNKICTYCSVNEQAMYERGLKN